MFIFRSMN